MSTDVENEGWRRSPPSKPYREVADVLDIPAAVLIRTREAFARYAAAKLEGCCFWYGVRQPTARVRAIVIPKQTNSWGNYHVSGDAMAKVSEATRNEGWRNLVQLHSHPGFNVEHSWYDDEMASTKKALSIVLPLYGKQAIRWPTGIGVHEYQDGYWHLLTDQQAARRVRVVGDDADVPMLDLR